MSKLSVLRPEDLAAYLPPRTDPKNIPSRIRKYFAFRRALFFKYDYADIRMDEVGWFSVTPEAIASYTAQRCGCGIMVDLFAGVGGNAIHFAQSCSKVYAIEHDLTRLACAAQNAKEYGVAHKIEFVHGDAFDFLDSLSERPDAIFLSPPWGGPEYLQAENYELSMIQLDWPRLLSACLALTSNLVLYLPRTLSREAVAELTAQMGRIEAQEIYTRHSLRALQLYSGNLAVCVDGSGAVADAACLLPSELAVRTAVTVPLNDAEEEEDEKYAPELHPSENGGTQYECSASFTATDSTVRPPKSKRKRGSRRPDAESESDPSKLKLVIQFPKLELAHCIGRGENYGLSSMYL